MSGYNGYVNNRFDYLNSADDNDPYGMGVNGYTATNNNRTSHTTTNDATFNYLNIPPNGNNFGGFYHDPNSGLIMAQDGNGAANSVTTNQTDYSSQLTNNTHAAIAAGYMVQQPAINSNANNIAPYAHNNEYLAQWSQQQQQQQQTAQHQQLQQLQQPQQNHHQQQQQQSPEFDSIEPIGNCNGLDGGFSLDKQSDHSLIDLGDALQHLGAHLENHQEEILPSRAARVLTNNDDKNTNNGTEFHNGSSLNRHTKTGMEVGNAISVLPSMNSIHCQKEQILSTENTSNGDILANFSISITSLSIDPLTAYDIMQRVENRSREVVSRYLPCVEFLVLVQQELRNGLEVALRGRNGQGRCGGMSTRQFYAVHFEGLPRRFCKRNERIMPRKEFAEAYKGLENLLKDVKKVQQTGKHEGMKNAFLGGMRDGESWGLRKWLSKNGGALHICNDIELIWGGLRNAKKDCPMIIELCRRIRPKVKEAYTRLKMNVPKAYQEVSSAHPYLPFFHRLESALKGLSEFDPEDDDVICLDDSDDEEDAKPAATGNSRSHNSGQNCSLHSAAFMNETSSLKFSNGHNDDDSDDDSEIEILRVKAPNTENLKTDPIEFNHNPAIQALESITGQASWICSLCTFQNNEGQEKCGICDCKRFLSEESDDAADEVSPVCGPSKQELAEAVDGIASELEAGRETRPLKFINTSDFWSMPSTNYVIVLRLFRDMILSKTSTCLMDPIALSDGKDELQRYYAMIRNPLGFRDIVMALTENNNGKAPGQLETKSLSKWNMFEGKWLIQAVDLVFLNTLAFIGKETTPLRKELLALRKIFWKEIRGVGCPEKKQIPPRRTENSDFLLKNRKKK